MSITKKELAGILAREAGERGHSAMEIERVLAAYFDPENPEMGLEKFMDNLAQMAVAEPMSRSERSIINALGSVVRDVRNARLFNDTYLGHMLTEASIPGMFGYILGIRTGSNTVAREVSFMESDLEPEAIRGLAELIGYDPEEAEGTFTSGGSMAIQTALVARRTQMENLGIMASRERPFVVIGTPYTHYSWDKMTRIVGGPSREVVKREVETDHFKMDPFSLDKQLQIEAKSGNPVMAVVAIGGETETGLIDPIDQLVDVASIYGVPVIVDGAYGAPYRLSRNRNLLRGIERSWATIIDPHKTLHTPYSNGAIIFSKKENAFYGFGDRDSYLGEGNHLGRKRIEGSMGPGSILSTVAVLRALGKEGLATVYDLSLDRAEYLYQRVSDSDFLVPLFYPELNILCFTLNRETMDAMGISSNEQLQSVIDELRYELDHGVRREGGYFFSSTGLPCSNEMSTFPAEPGKGSMPVFRAVLMHPRTTNEILNEAISGLEELIKKRIEI